MVDPGVVASLQALVNGDRARARATLTDGSLLAGALSTYLTTEPGAASVYDQPAAFAAFIRGGGNVGLYAATTAALAGLYDRDRPASLLDVGCGDGAALLPALARSAWTPTRIDVVEPSAALLDVTVAALRAMTDVPVSAAGTTVQHFLATDDRSFDLVQSTFALHTLPDEERTAVLRTLRGRTHRIAVVEFDVPDLTPRSPAYLEFLARTYERGLAEYGADRDLVAQGFLMPVLVGQLAPGAVRSTYEQPATAWRDQLVDAGFTDVVVEALFDYWSAPAFRLTARGAGRPPAAPVS